MQPFEHSVGLANLLGKPLLNLSKMNNAIPPPDKPVTLPCRECCAIEWLARERLRQARLSFNLALIGSAVSLCLVTFTVLKQPPETLEGFAATTSGVIFHRGFMRLFKDANDRLDKTFD